MVYETVGRVVDPTTDKTIGMKVLSGTGRKTEWHNQRRILTNRNVHDRNYIISKGAGVSELEIVDVKRDNPDGTSSLDWYVRSKKDGYENNNYAELPAIVMPQEELDKLDKNSD